MSTHSDPEKNQEAEASTEQVVKAAESAQAAVELLVKKIISVDKKVDNLLHPKFEFKLHQKVGETGTILDVPAYLNEIAAEGWIIVEAPAVGKIPHPQGFIDDHTGKPFLVPAIEVCTYRRLAD